MKNIEKLLLKNREELLYFLQNIGCPPPEDLHDGSCENVDGNCLECWKLWGERSTIEFIPSPEPFEIDHMDAKQGCEFAAKFVAKVIESVKGG